MNEAELRALSLAFAQAYDLLLADPDAFLALLESCEIRELQKGHELFAERTPGTAMYLLLRGRVRITKADARGAPQRIASVRAPSVLGQMSLLENAQHNATGTARAPTTVAVLPRAAFASLLGSTEPRGTLLRHLLLASMSEQLVDATTRIRGLIDPAAGMVDDETTEHGILLAKEMLEGWQGRRAEDDEP